MFTVVGQGKVNFLKKVSPKMTVGQISCAHNIGTKEEPKWEYTNLECKFVGECLQLLAKQGVKDGDRIEIENSVLQTNKYTKKKTKEECEKLVLTIFKACKVMEDLKPTNEEEMPF